MYQTRGPPLARPSSCSRRLRGKTLSKLCGEGFSYNSSMDARRLKREKGPFMDKGAPYFHMRHSVCVQ